MVLTRASSPLSTALVLSLIFALVNSLAIPGETKRILVTGKRLVLVC